MNKNIIIGIVVGLLLIIGIIAGIKINKENDSKKLEITTEINAGIPFKWEFKIADESIAKFDRSYVVRNDNTGGKVGGRIVTNHVFKGLKEGQTTITFKFVSITDDNFDGREEIYTVKVDKDLKIKLISVEK